jgi:hypothetical protein
MLEARVLQAPAPMQHISFTHPFAHRPLVEFMMAIPPGELCRPGEPRRLMRRAFAELLPAPILRRKSKASYTEIYRQAIVPLAAEFLKHPSKIRLVELGYVDLVSVTERLSRLVQGLDCEESQLRQFILLETWLRSRENHAGWNAAYRGGAENPEKPLRKHSTVSLRSVCDLRGSAVSPPALV